MRKHGHAVAKFVKSPTYILKYPILVSYFKLLLLNVANYSSIIVQSPAADHIPNIHTIETNYKMELNEDFPFFKKDPERAFQWTEQERKYAENGLLCTDIETLIKQVRFFKKIDRIVFDLN
jgi:hypothetical protein